MKLETVDLKLCQIQGKIFEESIGSLNCSSQVFIRRFMNSKVAKSFDDKSYLAQTSSIRDVYDELEESTMFVNFGGVRDTSVAKAFYTKGDNCIEQEQEQKVYVLRGA